MNRWLAIACLCFATELSSLQKEPWLGNWLEFEGSMYQAHTQSRNVDTKNGTKHKQLHNDQTVAALEFTPFVDFSAEVELDFSKTQKKSYGFEAFKGSCRYRLLNDLDGDSVSLTAGLVATLSTPSRIHDLSSQQHGVFQTEARVAVGRQFGIRKTSYYKGWGLVSYGLASSGSPWVGAELHIERVFWKHNHIDLFFRAQKGLSSSKLGNLSDFHSWSRVGYEYEELGLSFRHKVEALGSFYVEAATRVRARYCPKHTWSVQLGFNIPFAPW